MEDQESASQPNNPEEQQPSIKRPWLAEYLHEFKKLAYLAIPNSIAALMVFISGPISIIFCGALDKTSLATAGLAGSIFNVSGLSVVTGLLTATDTIFAQTFGAGKKVKLPIHLIRAIILTTLCCMACISLQLCIYPILILAKQDPIIAEKAADYLAVLSPGLWFAGICQLFTRYIQAQNHVFPAMLTGGFAIGLLALLHYIFLFVVKTGVNGSALAQVIAYAVQACLLLGYVFYRQRKEGIPFTFNRTVWYEWGGWMKLALPGIVMTSLGWTIFEIGNILAGVLGQEQLGAYTIVYQIEVMCYTLLPIGFGIATSIRTGQYLGAGSSDGPRRVIRVALIGIWTIAGITMILMFALRKELPKIFTSDSDVLKISAKLMPLIAGYQIFDATGGVCAGSVRGAGMQVYGAVNSFATLYGLGLPIALLLTFVAKMDVYGILTGLLIGTVLKATIYLLLTLLTNWDKQVAKAQARVNNCTATTSNKQNSIDNANTVVNEARPGDNSDRTPSRIASVHSKEEDPAQMTNGKLILRRSAAVLIILSLLCISLVIRWKVPWKQIMLPDHY